MIPHSRPTLSEKEVEAVSAVIRSGYIAQGEHVARFEKAFAGYVGVRYAVATSSGTAALVLALRALGVGAGDGVAMPSYVCSALLHATAMVDAEPVLVDIEDVGFNMDPNDLRTRLTGGLRSKVQGPRSPMSRPRTLDVGRWTLDPKAVILPHMFGTPATVESVQRIGLPVIEDGAMAVGAMYNGRRVGAWGVLSIFSFYATKMMTTGEGGMVVTDREDLAEKVRDIREYDNKQTHRTRFNFKMTDMQAAMGMVQLRKLDGFIRRRQAIAQTYNQAFGNLDVDLLYVPPVQRLNVSTFERSNVFVKPEDNSVFFRYVLQLRRGDVGAFITRLREMGIGAARPVFRPLHQYLGLPGEAFPNTERAFARTLSLPIYPTLSDEEVDQIVEGVKKCLSITDGF